MIIWENDKLKDYIGWYGKAEVVVDVADVKDDHIAVSIYIRNKNQKLKSKNITHKQLKGMIEATLMALFKKILGESDEV